MAATSFFPTKPLACLGDGGAIFTDDPDLAQRCRSLRTHGGERRHHHPLVGTNGRLDTLQAAVLVERLRTFPQALARRQALAAVYTAGLVDVVQVPVLLPGNTSAWAQYTITCRDADQRQRLVAACTEAGIATAIYYPVPVHRQPSMVAFSRPLPVTETICNRVLSLPFSTALRDDDQARIIAVVRGALRD